MKPSQALHHHRQAILDIIARHHATNPRVFGSVLHGQDHEGSDLDLLIDPTPQTTLLDIVHIQKNLQTREKPNMITTATLTSKHQLAIPKSIREQHHWSAGQEFALIPKDTGLLIIPVPEMAQLAGIAKDANPEGYRDREDRT